MATANASQTNNCNMLDPIQLQMEMVAHQSGLVCSTKRELPLVHTSHYLVEHTR